jgi:ATP-dependent DNA helicase RecQ
LLVHKIDEKFLRDRFTTAHPDIKYLRHIYQCLANYFQLASGSGKDQSFDFDLADFCQRYDLKSLNAFQALRRLEEEALISLSEAVSMPSTLKISLAPPDLYEFQVANANYDSFLKGLLRLYGGQLFSDYLKIEELKISKFLNLGLEEVTESLLRLQKLDVIDYSPQTDNPKLTLVTERRNTSELFVNTKRIDALKAADLGRINAILSYLGDESTCKMVQILAYFGEQGTACGKCDVCIQQKKKHIDYVDNIKEALTEGPLSIKELMARFSWNHEVEIKEAIKKMLDSGLINKEDGVLSLKL